jgi:hypothetical protein
MPSKKHLLMVNPILKYADTGAHLIKPSKKKATKPPVVAASRKSERVRKVVEVLSPLPPQPKKTRARK